MLPQPPEENKSLQLEHCKIIYTDLQGLKKHLYKYIGETEKNFLLTDTNTRQHCLPLLEGKNHTFHDTQIITLDAGEREKNIEGLNHIWNFLQHAGADRSSTLINLGGGMISDIGGFAASTYQRGMHFINVPTSLMGMADASIGGKTAINLGAVKNQAGTFAFAENVLICTEFLYSLPEDELLAGYAEVVKGALAFDKDFWYRIKTIKVKEQRTELLIRKLDEGILWKSIQLKVEAVKNDLNDHGSRQALNFGHSVGHGLEALYQSNGKSLPHGFAVAAGMICEAFISQQLTGLKNYAFKEIERYLKATFPLVEISNDQIDKIVQLIRYDKKNRGDDIKMSLLEDPGKCRTGVVCSEEMVRQALRHYTK
jgi:3-dehydroquinate synthase